VAYAAAPVMCRDLAAVTSLAVPACRAAARVSDRHPQSRMPSAPLRGACGVLDCGSRPV